MSRRALLGATLAEAARGAGTLAPGMLASGALAGGALAQGLADADQAAAVFLAGDMPQALAPAGQASGLPAGAAPTWLQPRKVAQRDTPGLRLALGC